MLGLMQAFPLIITRILTYAEKSHCDTEMVSRRLSREQFKDYRFPGA